MSWILNETYDVIENSKFPDEVYVNIPNDHKCIADTQRASWVNIANNLGIDFESTGYTVKVKNGVIYTPHVSKVSNKTCIVWGNFQKPLNELPSTVEKNIVSNDKRVYLELVLVDQDYLSLPCTMMLLKKEEDSPKGKELHNAPDMRVLLNKALRLGNLHEYLSEGFVRTKRLQDFAGQTLKIVDYNVNRFGKYELTNDKGEKILANSSITRKLERGISITEEEPATLTIPNEPAAYTEKGHPIYDAYLLTSSASRSLTFDFSDIDGTY